jgi:hypothetical protein
MGDGHGLEVCGSDSHHLRLQPLHQVQRSHPAPLDTDSSDLI